MSLLPPELTANERRLLDRVELLEGDIDLILKGIPTTVKSALAETRALFPEATFISVKEHAIYQPSWEQKPQADIQIEDRGVRREALSECMAVVREWAASAQ